jgi:hypothetical protein
VRFYQKAERAFSLWLNGLKSIDPSIVARKRRNFLKRFEKAVNLSFQNRLTREERIRRKKTEKFLKMLTSLTGLLGREKSYIFVTF